MRAGEIRTGAAPCHSTGPGAGGKGGKACNAKEPSLGWELTPLGLAGSLATWGFGFAGALARGVLGLGFEVGAGAIVPKPRVFGSSVAMGLGTRVGKGR